MSNELRVVSYEFKYQDLSIEYQDLRSKVEESPKTKYQSTNSVIARHEANFGANRTYTKDKTVIPVKTGILMLWFWGMY
jgi:hypothetical protein